MLRLRPRTITAFILCAFALLLGIRHLSFSFLEGGGPAERASAQQLEKMLPFLWWMDRTDYDLHLVYSKPLPIHPDVAIIDINERSFQQFGQFPFSRSTYQKLVHRLERAGAKVVAFDILFPEAERNESLVELQKLRAGWVGKGAVPPALLADLDQKILDASGDDGFISTLKSTELPIVLGFAFGGKVDGSNVKDISAEQLEILKKQFLYRVQFAEDIGLYKYDANLPVIPHLKLLQALNAKASLGAIIPDPDGDSVIRSTPAVIAYKGIVLGGLAVKAVGAYKGVDLAISGESGLELRARNNRAELHAPLSPTGSFLTRYYGGRGKFEYHEFGDVVNGKVADEKLRGKIIFVGSTAEGLKDIRSNPFSANYPGVEVHATIVSNILSGHFMEKDKRYFLYGYLFVCILGLFASFVVMRFHPIVASLGSVAAIALFQFLAQKAFFDNGVVVPTFLPSFTAVSMLFAGVLYRYFNEEQQKKMVRTAFSRYVSGAVVEEILKDPSKLRLGGQKRELTVMFIDLVGFTKLSEHLDASFVTQLLNEYFTRMTKIILQNHGTLDKFMGDGIMCFWGAPLELPDHARQACQAALEIVRELDAINVEWQEKHKVKIGLRVGVHTGVMAVGNMGSDQVFSYTVMGDNVNLGSRLEGVNNVYGTKVIVSEATAQQAGNGFLFRALDTVTVKGREDPVNILELVDEKSAESHHSEWMHAFASGLTAYREARWDEAAAAFGACLTLRAEDGPAKVFLERVAEVRQTNQGKWDGIWKLNAK